MNKQRRHFTGAEKVAILKRHLVDKVPVSDLCDELGLYPNLVYAWLKEFFENGHRAFENGRKAKAADDANPSRFTARPARPQNTSPNTQPSNMKNTNSDTARRFETSRHK